MTDESHLVFREKQKIRRIERDAVLAAVALTVGGLLAVSGRFGLSAALGGAVMSLNLHVLRRIVEGVVLGGEARLGRLFLRVGGKFLLLLALAAAAFLVLKADVIGFVAGSTNLLLAVAVETAREIFQPRRVGEES